MIKSINGAMFRKMILNGAKLLDGNKQHVDSLNVFPVPDGDTGTNMSLTMLSAAKEVSACPNNNINVLGDALAKGALRGARGNSGVITSQILKGMSNVLAEIGDGDITSKDLANALDSGTKIAYKAVTKPQEGTILTVIRTMSEHAVKLTRRVVGVPEFFQSILKIGEETLKQTPEMLPVLKKAGVVDAGGRGLLIIFQGFYNSLIGKEEVNLDFDDNIKKKEGGNNYEQFHVELQDLDIIEFAYCTEFFIVHLNESVVDADVDKFRDKLIEIGDCVLVIGDLSMIKVHVHTNNPGLALTYAVEIGELDRVKIENMLEQNRALMDNTASEQLNQYGMVSVCSGAGIAGIFKDLMVDAIVEGGQTMNPSAEDIAAACDKVKAKDIFVFPNNSNIILAAEQAKEISKRTIHVIPTKNVPQGLSAVIAFNPQDDAQTIFENMKDSIGGVKVGSITFASRDTNMDGLDICKNDIIGLSDKSILAKGSKIDEVAEKLIELLVDEDSCTITLYFGEDISETDAQELFKRIESKYPNCDVDCHNGGQSVYYYILSVE